MSCVAEPRVLIAGASGFAGAIAARLIDRHPHFALGPVTSRSDAGRTLDELYPHHRVTATLEEFDVDRHDDVDAAIVAYPHGAAAPVVAALRGRGVRVVDLSADFRLRERSVYEEWYVPHTAPDLLPEAVYGLTELHREAIAGAGLVANPGCFPTATLLALAPLARAGLVADVVVDAKTGVSGAGRAATEIDALRRHRRERQAVQGRRPPAHARDGPGAGAARGAGRHDVRPAPRPARPGRAGQLLRHAHRSR